MPSLAPDSKPEATGLVAADHPILLRDQRLDVLESTPELWRSVATDDRFRDGWLVSVFTYSETWRKRERHPEADELAYIISGAATFRIGEDPTATEVSLQPGQWAVIPHDTWHTASISSETTILFLTPRPATTIEELLD